MYIWGIFSLLDEATAKIFIQKCDDKLVNGIRDVQLCPDDRGLGHLMIVSENTLQTEKRLLICDKKVNCRSERLLAVSNMKIDHYNLREFCGNTVIY
jgi:hypothetical protein